MTDLTEPLGDVTLPDEDVEAWADWLAGQADRYQLWDNDGALTILAHAQDGVIWGRLEGKQLSLSSNAFPNKVGVRLRRATLLQLRLFSPAGELLLWRLDGDFAGRVVNQPAGGRGGHFDEWHQLWGVGVDADNTFTLMQEGQQGLFHAPPLPQGQGKAARLKVRHYFAYDDADQAYVALSRLVALDWA